MVKEVLYKLMAHPLKPKLLPIEQHLLPDLPTIVGNVDYQTLRAQLVRIHQLLVDGGSSGILWRGAWRRGASWR